MKTNRLSEIDLSRFTALSSQPMLEHALRRYNTGGGSWSYEPVRSLTAEILGAKTPLLGELPPVPWPKIEALITAASRRGEDQSKANALVGEVLHKAARRLKWEAVKFPMGSLPIGIGESVRYWSDVVLQDDGGLIVPFFDHRREHGVANAAIRQVVFSLQHFWVRDRHPDLADARLAVVRFPTAGKTRTINIEYHEDAELLPYDVLNARVQNVYETWARISEEKTKERRKTGTEGGGLFGG